MDNQVKSSYDPNIEGKRETIPFKPLVVIPHNIEGYIDYRKNDIEKDRIREKLKDLASAKIKREVDCLRSAGFLVYFSICSN